MIQILPADIILYPVTKKNWWLDKAIGWAQSKLGYKGAQYCHCAIWASPGKDYEARWPKTGFYNMDTLSAYEIWRPINISPLQRDEIIDSCRRTEGEWYDIPALLTAGLFQPFHLPVCSSYLAARFHDAGVCKEDRFDVPDQILEIIPSTLIAKGGMQ